MAQPSYPYLVERNERNRDERNENERDETILILLFGLS